MRITQGLIVSRTRSQLAQRLEQYQSAQKQVASGRRIDRPSDDVAGIDRSLRARAARAARIQESRNADDAKTWLNLADSKLQGAVSSLQRARELVIAAGDPADQVARDAIADELLAIRDELVSVANSKSQGRSLFAGTLPTDAVTLVGGVWTYTGNPDAIFRKLADEHRVQVNVTADDVFGFTRGNNVFSVLESAAAAVRAGDTAGIDAGISALDGSLEDVLTGLTRLGTATNRVEAAQIDQQRDIGSLDVMVSDIEDIDLAESIMEMQLQEVAYQAALSASSRALQPSLVDFLA